MVANITSLLVTLNIISYVGHEYIVWLRIEIVPIYKR